ncbi:hypothetical protein AGOR_G00184660 [Albula goreensis]|uniref:RAD51 interacting motif domain-containing protein n=1 Tax=Albula goreensis TaxID=1534307 RepID=A0A8T3CWH3_9TELE|nr:hypothetical protein AGOR_G00184660 [Albula goreensis]
MERPSRNRKQVNYCDSQNFDDDEDFACVKAPPNKKAKLSQKVPERERTSKPASQPSSQEAVTQATSHKERLSLDDKLYERDLEAALTLSMLQSPAALDKIIPSAKGSKEQPLTEAQTTPPSLLLSNCSVDVNILGLDKITDECGSPSAPSRQRQAASKATEQQRRMVQEERDSGRDEDYRPTCTPESESDEEFSGKEESDEEFTVKKTERKKTNKTETTKNVAKTKNAEKTAPPPASKKEKKPSKSPKSNVQVPARPAARSPAAAKPMTVTKKPAATSPVCRPAVSHSPGGGRLPKWNPPGQIGRSPNTPQSVQVKSPGQGLRLGLSRLARVKPLHPNAVGH